MYSSRRTPEPQAKFGSASLPQNCFTEKNWLSSTA